MKNYNLSDDNEGVSVKWVIMIKYYKIIIY